MRLAPTSLLGRRLERVRAAIEDQHVDALIVSHLPNVFYLSNFAGSAGTLVVSAVRLYLITDFRYSAAVGALLASPAAPPGATFVLAEGSHDVALANLLQREYAGARVAFESAVVTVKRHAWLASRLAQPSGGTALVASDGLVEGLRAAKDEHELAILRDAARRLSAVARDVLADVVRVGRREQEMAADIDARLRSAGFERPAFETIVASGPSSALPHARPGVRMAEAGDLVVLDFGGVLDGYSVDLTRTVVVGEASDEGLRALSGRCRGAGRRPRCRGAWGRNRRRRLGRPRGAGRPRPGRSVRPRRPGMGWASRSTKRRGSPADGLTSQTRSR